MECYRLKVLISDHSQARLTVLSLQASLQSSRGSRAWSWGTGRHFTALVPPSLPLTLPPTKGDYQALMCSVFLTQLSSADVIVPEELLPCPRGPQDSRSWCPLVRPRPDTLRLLLLHHEGPTILRPPRPGAPLRPRHCPLTTTSTAGASCWRECPPCPAASPSPWWWPEARPQWPGRCSSPW